MRYLVTATLLVTGLLLSLGSSAEAQNCYPYSGPQQTNYQQTYPTQKIVSPYVQGIAYAPVAVDSYAVPVQAYAPAYYYSVGDAYREKAYIRDVIREELRALVSGTVPATNTPAASVTAPTNRPAPVSSKQKTGAVPDDITPADIQQKVIAAYQGRANCLSCHGAGASPKGDLRLVLEDGAGGIKLVRYDSPMRWKIYGMASVGAMPPAAANDASKAMETNHLPNLLQYAALKD